MIKDHSNTEYIKNVTFIQVMKMTMKNIQR